MKNRFLGIICILYSSIFIYVCITNKLKNFLSPSMQIYIKLSIIPLILIGLVILLNNKINYKFKISDLILLLPLLFIILSGDGRLTSTYATTKAINIKEKTTYKEDNKEEIEVEEDNNKDYDFTNIDFNVIDETYTGLSGYFYSPPEKAKKYIGKTIKVRGFALTKFPYIPTKYFSIGKYEISCCTADATFSGFVAKYDKTKIKDDKWYEIEGILEEGKDTENNTIIYIKVINIKEIDKNTEEQYVYPCYAYDEGKCTELSKYNLEY